MRTLVDLDHTDLTDESRAEINVYDEDGYRIPRRTASTVGQKHCGVLINLNKVGDLFLNRFDNECFNDPLVRPVKYYVYPQGFITWLGHFQAEGLFNSFDPFIRKINHAVGVEITSMVNNRRSDSDDESDSEHESDIDGRNNITRHQFPITGVACQGYNEIVHRTRGHGGVQHDVQRGLITAILAGTHTTSASHQRTFNKLREECMTDMPHEKFDHKLSNERVTKAFRLENVFVIDIKKVKEEYRNGR